MRLGFSPVTARMLGVEEAFRLASELHLDFVELAFDLHEVLPELQTADRIAALSRATGLATTLHLSYVDLNLASLMPIARAAAVDRTIKGLEYAQRVGATCGVLHTGQHYLRHPQADVLATAALDAALQALAGSPVRVALENLALADEDFLRTPAELRALADRHALGTCLDFGHAHVQGVREGTDAVAAYLAALGPTLAHLHVHGNHGARDEHLASDQGTLDYAPYAAFLRDFAGTVCLEIATGADGVRASAAHLRRLVGDAA